MWCNSNFAQIIFFQNIHATSPMTLPSELSRHRSPTSAASQVRKAAEENVNRPSFMVARTVKGYGQLGTSYPSTIFIRTSRSNIWRGGL
jgi:hypothetical protein